MNTGGGGGGGYPDTSARATYGETYLSSGFNPDPHRINLVAGGGLQASVVSSSCRGAIATAPDYQITYTAGSLPLAIQTLSSSDTTLVVNAPDGEWYCDDDSGDGNNAQVYFSKPASGVYDIWVGTYSGGNTSATLLITELQ
ncbi:MAG: peptidase S1 [Brevundimonas sp.]|nr:MAG: peptidase S1 [Brevundimonas sp.]